MTKRISIFFLIYIFLGSVIIFLFPKKVSKEYIQQSDINNYYADQEGPDRAIILDNPLEAGLARLYIIENAKESLNIAYFSINEGETPNVFFGALFDAADRGVQVNILLDGIFHGMRGDRRYIIHAIANHPNMHLKFYEKFNPLMPWTINNRMHDKYIIADNEAAIIGGRNIGDKYFAPEWYEKAITNDRDVVILNYNNDSSSAVNQMSKYFNEIWEHKFSKKMNTLTRRIFRKKAEAKVQSMKEKAAIARERYKEQFDSVQNLYDISVPTNKITFIHNPITRFSKEPWCWYELVGLAKNADKSVFVQSPYVIPSRKMTKNMIDVKDMQDKSIVVLTNSMASTPNVLAFSGYKNYRKRIVDYNVKILEIQSIHSVHSKAFVIDNDIAAIGSFNVDPRSAFLSTESMVVINSEEFVQKFGINIHDYTDESLIVDKDYKYIENEKIEALRVKPLKKLLINILSIFSKVLDALL